MAVKKCPHCGKKIAEKAQYCIFCAARFDDDVDEIAEKEVSLPSELVEDIVGDVGAVSASEPTMVMDVAEIDQKVKEEYIAQDATQITDAVSEDTVCLELPPDAASAKRKSRKISNGWLVVSISAFTLIVIIGILLLVQASLRASKPNPPDAEQTTMTTVPTRDAKRDAWLQTFIGQWVDEQSVGKGDLERMGGYVLTITKIENDTVFFDLHAYSGGATPKMASVTGFHETLNGDVLHFSFTNDGLGHSGEGHMQLHETGVNMEVVIDDMPEEDPPHSLAVNAVFYRQQVPSSEGLDVRTLKDETAVIAALGEPADVSEPDDKGLITYTYTGVTVKMREDKTVHSVVVDFSTIENKESYCFECVDGSDVYDTVKAYYGEAEQDYQESPTEIHVLQYPLGGTSFARFIFSCDEHLLVKIAYVF